MPKEGYQSLTIGDIVYDKWHSFHTQRKNNFKLIGINSLSGLMTVILDAVSKQNGTKLTEIIQMGKDHV